MKVPFDMFAMAAARDDISTATDGRIQRIIQPSAATVGLAIYASGSRRWLVLSSDARYARVHLTEEALAKGFPTPSPFVMLLRKYLEGARLTDVKQLPYERVFQAACEGRNGTTRLVAEVMGKHSNVILVDDDGRILGALKTISHRLSRVRPIMPGLTYSPPPAQKRAEVLFAPGPRIDPCEDDTVFRSLIGSVPPETRVFEAVAGLLPGCGSFLAHQIALRARVDPQASITDVAPVDLVAAAQELYGLLRTRAWEPCTFRDQRGRPDFAPYIPLEVADLDRVATISAAIEACVSGSESRDALSSARKTTIGEIERALRAVAGKLESLNRGLKAAGEAESVMEKGRLVLAYQHAVEPKSDRLEIPELGVSIVLDGKLSPRENAERMFRRYKKLRDASRRIPGLIQATEVEASRLRDLLVFARIADTETALRDVQREISPLPRSEEPTKKRSAAKSGPARFRMDGYTALVGRNAQENETLTFDVARRTDLWLHARGRTGAHVVLQGEADPSEGILASAAALAAYFSEGRNDTRIDVDAVRVRDIRKVPGGPPGRVTYRQSRTIRVEPSLKGWERR
jgi:predicted ribosome quality control (RQC) complex YloA/Tae2 family protein